MSVQKFLHLAGGLLRSKSANDASAGSGDAGKIVALNADGLLDPSMLLLKRTVVTNNNLSLLATHRWVMFDTGSSNRTCTPPDPAGLEGQVWLIGKFNGGSGTVTIIGGNGGSDYIIGANNNNELYWLFCDGTGYFIK